MKLTFLGTRGFIDGRSRLHERHSSLLISYGDRNVMIDAGEDWRGHLEEIGPDAIIITHSHPDHCWALKSGAPCPVYATGVAWKEMTKYPIEERHTMEDRTPSEVAGITFEAFRVEHSTVAPAVGYRISAGDVKVFYSPDVVHIYDREEALAGIRLFVGDGATIKRQLIRKRGDNLVGHASIQTQLTWCQKEEVTGAIFTHCGSAIVSGNEQDIAALVSELGEERGVEAKIAYDGMEITLT